MEQLVTLAPDQTLEVKLTASPGSPADLLDELLARAAALLRSNALAEWADHLRSAVSPTLSALLPLIHGLKRAEDEGPAASGIDVLLAAEVRPAAAGPAESVALATPARVQEYLAGLEVRRAPLDGAFGPIRHPAPGAIAGVASLTEAVAPGPYWLWLQAGRPCRGFCCRRAGRSQHATRLPPNDRRSHSRRRGSSPALA